MKIRWAFVTGADRGLGLGLVKALLARDYHVFAGQFMPSNSDLEQLSAVSGDRLRLLPLDISDEASVGAAIAAVHNVTDQLDILINNAAILGDTQATIEDQLNFEEMEQVFRVNTLGALRMSNGLIASILRSDSKLIVNISSEAGSIGSCQRTSWFAYCMSKSALNMQAQLIHNQIAGQGGKVLVIHPGYVQSYMQGSLNTEATLTPDESAAHILGIMEHRLRPDYSSNKLELIEYTGNTLPW